MLTVLAFVVCAACLAPAAETGPRTSGPAAARVTDADLSATADDTRPA
ncbi:hypothetical protein [Streptomyces sp. NPDC051677]